MIEKEEEPKPKTLTTHIPLLMKYLVIKNEKIFALKVIFLLS